MSRDQRYDQRRDRSRESRHLIATTTSHSVSPQAIHRAPVNTQNDLMGSDLMGLAGMMGSAAQVTMSRSTVVYDGAHTYVEAEEHEMRDGQWERRRVEGVWEGDQSQEAIARLSRSPRSSRLSAGIGRPSRSAQIIPPRVKR